MSDESTEAEEGPKKSGLGKALLLGVPLMLVGGGGAFYAAYSGMLPLGGSSSQEAEDGTATPDRQSRVAFIPIEPMIVSIGPASQNRHLRFEAQLEVERGETEAVETVMPRVVDVLNGYLRAVDMALLEDPSALTRLRAQMLRRIQIVSGEGKVRDLLIMEFVLS